MFSSPQSIVTSIKPLIIATQFTAFTLFSINTKTWKAEIRKSNILIGILSICVSLSIHHIFWSTSLKFGAHGTEMTKTIMPKLVYCNIAIHTTVKFWNFINRQKVVDFLKQINEIDEKFKELGIYFNYSADRRMLTRILIGNVALILTFKVISLSVHLTFLRYVGISLSIMNLYSFTCGCMLVLQLTTAMIGIRRRFQAVNNFLILNPIPKSKDIKILSKIHLMSTNLIESFNIIYGPALMLYNSLGFAWFSMFMFKLVMSSSHS